MEKLKTLIVEGKLRQLIKLLNTEVLLSGAMKDELVMISAQLTEIEKQINEGVLRSDEISIEKQKVKRALLNLVNKVEQNERKNITISNANNRVRKHQKVAIYILPIVLIIIGYFYFNGHLSPNRDVGGPPNTDNALSIKDGSMEENLSVEKIESSPFNYPMIHIKTDTFLMGDDKRQGVGSERPVHKVYLSSYYIGKYEVTQYLWESVMGTNPSSNEGCPLCPVENVTWHQIQEFIEKLNSSSNSNYSLPTEAQWEFAARGGKFRKGHDYAGSNIDSLEQFAWFDGNPLTKSHTHKVGLLKPNELGLYDMTGNVHEYCSDWFQYDYYTPAFTFNPAGPDSIQSNGKKVYRGGAFNRKA